MAEEYKYRGLELTPTIFAELLIKFYDGKMFQREDALSTIAEYHKENGGFIREGKSLVAVFKKTAQYLKTEGLENVGYGTWRLNHKVLDVVEIVKPTTKDSTEYNIDKELGKGKASVYLYYYDSYKELAELKGSPYWECKIGRTDVAPLQRIMGQAGTCYPEFPHIALVIYCDNSALLESALHSALKIRKKHLPKAPGAEWFMTNPQEIEALYNAIVGTKE